MHRHFTKAFKKKIVNRNFFKEDRKEERDSGFLFLRGLPDLAEERKTLVRKQEGKGL